MYKCPGNDGRFLRAELQKCPNCGYEVEIFSDEAKVKCPECKREVRRGESSSCIDWCQYARQCIGEKPGRESKRIMTKGAKGKKSDG